MSVYEETNSRIVLRGVAHELKGVRNVDRTEELRDAPVILDVTLNGALLDEVDRLALARWLLVGLPYSIEGRPDTRELSRAELAVLGQLAIGGTNVQLAARLHLSENTVRSHLAHIYAKWSVPNRTVLLRIARERGLL